MSLQLLGPCGTKVTPWDQLCFSKDPCRTHRDRAEQPQGSRAPQGLWGQHLVVMSVCELPQALKGDLLENGNSPGGNLIFESSEYLLRGH